MTTTSNRRGGSRRTLKRRAMLLAAALLTSCVPAARYGQRPPTGEQPSSYSTPYRTPAQAQAIGRGYLAAPPPVGMRRQCYATRYQVVCQTY